MNSIFYVYILRCKNNSYYIGQTDNIEERVGQHLAGGYCTYTAKRLPVEVVFCQNFESRGQAIEMERKIKKWRREKKEALIAQNWNTLPLLSKKIFNK